jgi:hypothetical protein
VADILVTHGVVERGALQEAVAALYNAPPASTSLTIDALLQIPSRRLVVLNYDRSFELRAEDLGVEYESLVLSRDAARRLGRRRLTHIPDVARGLTAERCVAAADRDRRA